ncbi:hypothetical protein [Phytoactinopolyspora halotolerans]|uniref:Uncharacterized protein n=1 Tax=Phytoactinopolyspora halotolerans TaxID=1981512 RepID=A0A6L9S1S3_9ACTN|nr:hypothetical protein [Phytoactinopolyspora halotolerans]NED98938.1 hypothetical protein [Phytoactinopolyspora halotolerans]
MRITALRPTTPRRQLSRWGAAWRLSLVVLGLAALMHGTLRDSDDFFPFGSMAQYASAHDLNGTTRSTYILADTEGGERGVRVPLNATGTGIGRAEVEGQLGDFLEDPSLMQIIADAYREIHPDRDQYTRLYLMRDVYQLRDGYVVGEPETTLLAEWEVER